MTPPVVRRLHLATDPLTREQANAAQAHLLWTPQVLSRWGTAVGLSLIGLVYSWYSVAGKATWNDQVAPLNLGIVSVVVTYGAGLSLLLAGRRSVGIRQVALLGEPPVVAPGSHPTELVAHSDAVVSGPGLHRYHRADCSMAAGKHFAAASRAEHETAGRTGCGVCRP
jgi:hypothetical protein